MKIETKFNIGDCVYVVAPTGVLELGAHGRTRIPQRTSAEGDEMTARVKLIYVPWYRPIRLVRWSPDKTHYDFIGWVWRQEAVVLNNLVHGWIAFLEHQTEEEFKRHKICERCGK